MAIVSGIDGSITLGSNVYDTSVTGWTIDITNEEVDTTKLGDSWKAFQGGLRAATGSYTALIDEADSDIDAISKFIPGASFSFVFSFAQGTSSDGAFVGSGVITSVSAASQTESGASTVTSNFNITGTLAMTERADS